MKKTINDSANRRKLLKSLLVVPLLSPGVLVGSPVSEKANKLPLEGTSPLKVSLNAFSFNGPLSSGKMTIEDMLTFCASKGFLAVDITAYYFPGYPAVPSDDYLYQVKRKAFSLGVEISGTGVRNDFTEPEVAKRKQSVALVKNWIEAAEKIGAPVIRIFSGNQKPDGYTREQIFSWMIKDIQECIDYGKSHGVVVAIQNHDDFIKTADNALQFFDVIKSEWFGLILDTGSYRVGDPYKEIEKTVRHAVNWQIKEKVFIGGKEVDVDMPRLINIIKASGYRGYIPLETLGAGDPEPKIIALLEKIKQALNT